MARIALTLPDTFAYSTELTVRIQDINYGNHVGNDAFVSLLHEARIRYFNHLGYSETDIEGCAIVISDLAVIYKAQARHGDRLKIELVAKEFNKYGCDIFYRVTRVPDNSLVLEAKTGIVFFNYHQNKVTRMPEKFAETAAKRLSLEPHESTPR
jgi:acyl-CoA thioesterase FadM